MFTKKLTWQLLAGYLTILVGSLAVPSWYTATVFKDHFFSQTIANETNNTYLIIQQVLPLLVDSTGAEYAARVDSLCKNLGSNLGMRITVILPDGVVIGDSHRSPDSLENHRYRPEVTTALEGKTGVANRLSVSINQKMLYVASPVLKGGSVIAVVRTAVATSSISAALALYYKKIALAAFGMACIAILLGLLFARRIIIPIQQLKSGAERFAVGDLGTKVSVSHIDELRHLGTALNEMAAQLDSRINTITAQRNEQQAILSSMSEAVIAADSNERILSVNAAAAAMFGFDLTRAPGKLLGEIVRNSALQEFVRQVLASTSISGPVERDIVVPGSAGDCFLQMHGTVLRGAADSDIGALVVASDVTRLRQLEAMRKEFVANVSHELRTPLTTIKGFVETLAQGALDNRQDAVRFLRIIEDQVDRLNGLIEDLLSLAVIERGEEIKSLQFTRETLIDAVRAAVKSYEPAAAAKNIVLRIEGDTTCLAAINRPLFEQAVGNLIDNAVKYSEAGNDVTVTVSRDAGFAVVSVADNGIGIAPEHLDRLYERFYRVDKARSRKLGGTGLGLSIVKHIASSHNGTVSVKSTPGVGSTFYLKIPGK